MSTVHARQLPGWATPHNLALIAGVTAAAVVIVMLARAVGRLSRAVRVAAAPAPAPKPAGLAKPLAVAAVIVAGLLLVSRREHAATGVKASPAPVPTVTVTAPPHAAAPHAPWLDLPFLSHLSGTDWTVITVVALLVAYSVVRPLLKRGSS